MASSSDLRFDDHLDSLGGPMLKQMARLWSGSYKMNKPECLMTIRRGLNDPAQVRAVVASLKPYEKTALAFVKQAGGIVDTAQLTIALQVCGAPLPDTHGSYYSSGTDTELIRLLIGRCIIMGLRGYHQGKGFTEYESQGFVFSDTRMLAHVGPVECQPFQIGPVAPPESSAYRRPPTVVFDIVHVLKAVEGLGGLELKLSGEIRATELRKLLKAIGLNDVDPDVGLEVDGMRLPNPSVALTGALLESGLLTLRYYTLVVQGPIDRLIGLQYDELVRPLLNGFIRNAGWREWKNSHIFDYNGRDHVRGRQALVMALAALPADSDGFFSFEDVERSLFERVGECFSFSSVPYRPDRFGGTREKTSREMAVWRTSLRSSWLKTESIWIRHALTTWLYYLGIVELGIRDGCPVSLRLTDLGRMVLHPEMVASAPDAAVAKPAPWIVQPNFDIVVYIDRIEAAQLVFLARVADRLQVHQHVAHYRLARESVYRGLEAGLSLDDVVAGLKAGAGVDLPQNVMADLCEWGAMHGQLLLHRSVRLLEFADDKCRQGALDAGLKGAPVGDRFVLIAPDAPAGQWTRRKIDYSTALPKCLTVTEDGLVRMRKNPPDLLIRAQLDNWAERISEEEWGLTRGSVSAASRAKARVSQLLLILQQRLEGSLPPLLGFALRAWAGERFPVNLSPVIVLRCSKPSVLQAIMTSERLRPFLLGQLAPDTILVDSQHADVLRERLAWAGLRLSETMKIEEVGPEKPESPVIRRRGRPRRAY